MGRLTVKAAPVAHFAYLVEKTGCGITSDFKAIEAVCSTGNIKGMVGFCNWTPNAVQMHFAFETPIALRSLVRPAFSYPFEEGGRGVAIGLIPAFNHQSLRVASKLGFEFVTKIEDGHSVGVDMVVLQLRRENCRWLEDERRAA